MISQGNCKFEKYLFGVEVNFSFLETGFLNGNSFELQSVFISGVLVRHSETMLVSLDSGKSFAL